MSIPRTTGQRSSRNIPDAGKTVAQAGPSSTVAKNNPAPTAHTGKAPLLRSQTDGAKADAQAWIAAQRSYSTESSEERSEPRVVPRAFLRRAATSPASPQSSTSDSSAPAPHTPHTVGTTPMQAPSASASTTTTTTTTTATTTTTSTTTTTAATASQPAPKTSSSRSMDGAALPAGVAAIVAAGLQGRLSPESLGRLLVTIESDARQTPLEKSTIHDILRRGLSITNYDDGSGKLRTINVIESFSMPFMRAHLDTADNAKALKTMMRRFDKVADQVNLLADNKTSNQILRDPAIVKLMQPVVDPFLDKFLGAQRTLASSAMPEPMKRLLIAIDKHIILWFNESGSGKLSDLQEARRNAIISFLSTRSLMPIWTEQIRIQASDPGRYKKMSTYLNSYLAQMADDFIADVMITQPAQSAEQKGYVERLAGRRTLMTKTSMPKLPLASTSVLANEKSLKAMRGGVPWQSASPRKPSGASDQVQQADKSSKIKDMQRMLERAQLVDEIAKTCDLERLDFAFYQHLKESIVNGSARGFDNFKRDPIASCLQRAKAWYAQSQNATPGKQSVSVKVLQNLQDARDVFLPDLANTFKRMNLQMPSNPFDGSDSQSASGPLSASRWNSVGVSDSTPRTAEKISLSRSREADSGSSSEADSE